MGIVWHQQHSTNQLRTEFREDNRQLREDFNTANRELREDFKVLRDDHDKLRDAVAQNGQRLARIEGHLGIGIPSTDDPSDPVPE